VDVARIAAVAALAARVGLVAARVGLVAARLGLVAVRVGLVAVRVGLVAARVGAGFWRRQAPACWHLCCAPVRPQCGVGVSVTTQCG
jgi:hypothetical protein